MTQYRIIEEALKEAAGRGLTCHELAAKLRIDPKQVGKALSRMRDDLRHMDSERDGQKVILWAGEETHG